MLFPGTWLAGALLTGAWLATALFATALLASARLRLTVFRRPCGTVLLTFSLGTARLLSSLTLSLARLLTLAPSSLPRRSRRASARLRSATARGAAFFATRLAICTRTLRRLLACGLRAFFALPFFALSVLSLSVLIFSVFALSVLALALLGLSAVFLAGLLFLGRRSLLALPRLAGPLFTRPRPWLRLLTMLQDALHRRTIIGAVGGDRVFGRCLTLLTTLPALLRAGFLLARLLRVAACLLATALLPTLLITAGLRLAVTATPLLPRAGWFLLASLAAIFLIAGPASLLLLATTLTLWLVAFAVAALLLLTWPLLVARLSLRSVLRFAAVAPPLLLALLGITLFAALLGIRLPLRLRLLLVLAAARAALAPLLLASLLRLRLPPGRILAAGILAAGVFPVAAVLSLAAVLRIARGVALLRVVASGPRFARPARVGVFPLLLALLSWRGIITGSGAALAGLALLALTFFRRCSAGVGLPLLAVRLLILVARRRRRLPRRRGGVDLQRPPFRHGDVRCLGPRVLGHRPILEHGPRTSPEPFRNERRRPAKHLSPPTHQQLFARLLTALREAGLDADARQTEIGVFAAHADRDWRRRRHADHLLGRLLDRHVRRHVRLDVDPILHLLRRHGLATRRGRGLRLEHQPVGGVFGSRAVGVEVERERAAATGEILLADRERHLPLAITAQIDPGALERMIAFRDDRHLRALDGAEVALPLHGLIGLARVLGVVVPHLPHEQRRRIDNHHADPRAAGFAG